MTRTAPHKELLDGLAQELVREKFDLNVLTAGIVASKAYQRESRSAVDGTSLKVFARMSVRGLSADQLCDSMIRAGGFREPLDASKRAEFLARFQQVGESSADRQISVLQVLNLMNGPLVNDAVNLERGPTLMAIVEAPYIDTAGRIDALYFATLSRPPRGEERARWLAAVEKHDAEMNRRQALADLFWAAIEQQRIPFQSLSYAGFLKGQGDAMSPRTRREWLFQSMGASALSASGWLGDLAVRAAGLPERRRACILLWMHGGPSQMDTFDMKPGHDNG